MRIFYIIIPILFTIGCAPSRFVEPLEKDQWAVGGSVGGPLVEFGGVGIPAPLSSIEAGYGLDSNLTIYTGIHTTSFLFGTGHMDIGATYRPLKQKGYWPNVSVSGTAQFAFSPSTRSFNFWPMIDANAYWNYGKRRNYFYVGFNNTFILKSGIDFDRPNDQRVLFSPQFGHVFKATENRYQIFAEVKLLGPYIDSEDAFVPYTGILGTQGATGIYIGFRKPLNRKK
ncbi:MAG: hypothetical protein NXI10_09505 [bacterium]|nr:hypothetical protein [bacterium]